MNDLNRTKLEERLARHSEAWNSLHKISLDLLNRRELQQLLQSILDEAARLLDSPYGMILFPEDDALVPEAFTAVTPLPADKRFTREAAPLSWKAFDTGLPAAVDDYAAWAAPEENSPARRLQAAACVPILVGEKCIGVLGFARTDPDHAFTNEDLLSGTLFADLAALAIETSRLNREIELLATMDELTGIRNRRSLIEFGEREVRRSIRYKRSLAALMLDVDYFKQVNDAWGYATGDRVLRGIARQFLAQIRATDTVGRYQADEDFDGIVGRLGGEEFVILLPETTLEQALVVAERIRSSVEKMVFDPLAEGEAASPGIRVTVSIGASALRLNRDSLLELLTRADQALRTAKENGRNQASIQI